MQGIYIQDIDSLCSCGGCFFFCFSRGVSINVLRHEAEFYGITPLGNFLILFFFFLNMRSSHSYYYSNDPLTSPGQL